MRKAFSLFLCLCILITALSGCAPELHERLLISAIGVDLEETGYRVTVRAAVTDGSGTESSYIGHGETVPKALEQISDITGKKPLYSHNSLVIFGKACAKKGLENCLDFFIRHYDSRPNVKIFLADGTAENILSIPKEATMVIQTSQITDLLKAEEYSGTAVDTDLIGLINGAYGTGGAAVLPVLKPGEVPALSGAVLLRGLQADTMLDENAIRGYLALTGNIRSGETIVQDEECGDVSFAAEDCSSSIHFTGTEKSPRFEIEVQIKGEITSISSGIRHLKNTAFPRLESAYANAVLQNIQAYLSASVYNSGLDAAGLGRVVLREAPEIWHAVSEDAENFYKKAVFDIRTVARIERVEEEDTPYL